MYVFAKKLLYCCTQLEGIWVEDLEQAADKKVHEECLPGKPMSVFTSISPRVSV